MAGSYRISNWAQYQHYTKRSPPWVKLYFDLLSSETWVTGDDKTRCLMIACILAASRNGGNVPCDPAYVQKLAHLNSPPDFRPLILNGFLDASNVLASCTQDASNTLASLSLSLSESISENTGEENTRERVSGNTSGVRYNDENFNVLWKTYPNKSGKFNAFKAWKALKPDAITRQSIEDAIFWQRRTLKWTKDGGQYVPMLATYLNGRMWEDEKTDVVAEQPDIFKGCEPWEKS